MDATGHKIVPRTFGGGLGQDRRLDVEELPLEESVPHGRYEARAVHELLLHVRPTQVEKAVTQTQVDLGVQVTHDLKRRQLGRCQFLDALDLNLDQTRGHVRVGFFAQDHFAGDADHILGGKVLCALGPFPGFRAVEDHLGQTLDVPHIDKVDAPEIAPLGDPAVEGDRLAHVVFTQLTAAVRPTPFHSHDQRVCAMRIR